MSASPNNELLATLPTRFADATLDALFATRASDAVDELVYIQRECNDDHVALLLPVLVGRPPRMPMPRTKRRERCRTAMMKRVLAMALSAAACGSDSGAVVDASLTEQDATVDGSDAAVLPSRRTYVGALDGQGNATLSPSEIDLADLPVTMGYVYSTQFAEPGYVPLGNIIPADGEFRFQAGAANANAPYILVTDQSPTKTVRTGNLDGEGNATLSPNEIDLTDLPVTIGYVYSTQFAEPGYVPLGNIIPADGEFRFQAGAANANAPYILVTDQSPTKMVRTGNLDGEGNATLSPNEIDLTDLPVTIGYVYSTQFAEPGYVPLGNIIPADGEFRFQAGAANANASYVLVTL